ncbi:carbohydrate ABC transporter substrate-binding protein [Rhizobium mayense]|uniref:Carbohydrate ABC transporter substrate-binding protein n=1 Tax=Rhizobium mayense TaxID=1312184 RepID=A0ABT7JP76_9HYPH|nr:carbohydrate ABC transporter substrate-binding protein [Rhizobium mayense]MDL2398137.1 carbohydrate ABC transporter substrate-binding protein [Rhizobium mayense]
MTFIGLTWDHPRGYDALAETARRVNEGRSTPLIHWNKQPLEGFESAPIAELAERNDLLVMDHPHIGEAVAEECFLPLEDLYPTELLQAWQRDSVGPSAASYRWDGRTWALPLDVATQVMARRIDYIAEPPRDWEEVVEHARHLPVALSLAGPHAVLTLMSMVAGAGGQVAREDFLSDIEAASALDIMNRLYALRRAGSERLNPIALLEAMVRSEDIALVPLVFGYVTYAFSRYGARAIGFSDTIRAAGGKGGVIGGTGIAFSRRCHPTADLLAHIASLLSMRTQIEIFPAFGGQPSARAAWQDAEVNGLWGEFYRNTLSTAETALLRPRFDGYIAFQTAAAECIRAALERRENPETTLSYLRSLWRRARHGARGHIE